MKNIGCAIIGGILTGNILNIIINRNFLITRNKFIILCSLFISYKITQI